MCLSVQNCVQDVHPAAAAMMDGDDPHHEQTERQAQTAAGDELGQHEQVQRQRHGAAQAEARRHGGVRGREYERWLRVRGVGELG